MCAFGRKQHSHIVVFAKVCEEYVDIKNKRILASLFIVTSVKRPDGVIAVMQAELSSTDAGIRTAAIRRFHALWRNRFHVWLKMEDGAQMNFKVTYLC